MTISRFTTAVLTALEFKSLKLNFRVILNLKSLVFLLKIKLIFELYKIYKLQVSNFNVFRQFKLSVSHVGATKKKIKNVTNLAGFVDTIV